ncbi:unnamed protein product [Cylindrotheca closterium]|uniref:Uncharacterized protein n=1 Tax=Cylindrotheca closterium TaxID=2856 RepID=A0AAD2GBD9_9STRA|nr:unnamed protein product [Cylindrotheca closterium]
MDQGQDYLLGRLVNQAKEAIAKACIQIPLPPMDDHHDVIDDDDDDESGNEFREVTPIIVASDFDETYELSVCPETGRQIIEYLDLSEFEIRFTPEELFEFDTMLQSLHFSRCHALAKVSPSIRKLKGLTQLDLPRCTSLTQLPDEIFVSLTQLSRLTLTHCSNLQDLPRDWSGMRNLTSLYLEGCTSLKEIPNALWDECHNLVYLGLARLKCINPCLPDGIRNLTELKALNVRGCPYLKYFTNNDNDNDDSKDNALAPLTRLHSIFASNTPISKLPPLSVLAGFPRLKVLDLKNSPNIPLAFQDEQKFDSMGMIRLLDRTRLQAGTLELVLWKTWGWSIDPDERAENRLSIVGMDAVIQSVVPFLCGEDGPELLTFCCKK